MRLLAILVVVPLLGLAAATAVTLSSPEAGALGWSRPNRVA